MCDFIKFETDWKLLPVPQMAGTCDMYCTCSITEAIVDTAHHWVFKF